MKSECVNPHIIIIQHTFTLNSFFYFSFQFNSILFIYIHIHTFIQHRK